jgi:hypothetical protein
VLSTEHKQFFADNIYAIDSFGGTGQGTIEVYNITLGGAVITWSPTLSDSFTGAYGSAAVVGTIARVSDNLFCNNTQVSSQLQQQQRVSCNTFNCSQSAYVCVICSKPTIRTAHKF